MRNQTTLLKIAMFVAALAVSSLSSAADPSPAPKKAATSPKADPAKLARGKYLVKIAGCNDCHTPNYLLSAGKVDEKLWLTGDKLGWRGPWGTTYSPNLRLYFDKLSEDQWVTVARNLQTRPPMPWFTLREMNEQDLRAIHAYARSLGLAGEPAPAYLPPDKEPPQPYAQFPSPPPAKK